MSEKDQGAIRVGATGLRGSERFWGLREGLLRGRLKTSERTTCIGELITEHTSQRSPGTLSQTLSEALSECHFFLRVLLPLIVLPLIVVPLIVLPLIAPTTMFVCSTDEDEKRPHHRAQSPRTRYAKQTEEA